MTISNDSRTRIKKAFEPLALGMGRLGLTPDALTLIGFGTTVVGAVLIAEQLWLAGGIVIFLGGGFDLFDGTLARATGRVSRLGAFMDSVFDRAGEVIVYLGIGMAAIGIMPREVRLVVLSVGLVLAGLLGTLPDNSSCPTCAGGMAFPPGALALFLALGIITAGSILTVIQRILHVRSQARHQSTQTH